MTYASPMNGVPFEGAQRAAESVPGSAQLAPQRRQVLAFSTAAYEGDDELLATEQLPRLSNPPIEATVPVGCVDTNRAGEPCGAPPTATGRCHLHELKHQRETA